MKRHVVSLLSCGLLAGCATSPPPIDEPSALPTTPNTSEQPSPAAFHFKSGTLEIGDFDPYTLGDDIFDPCTEISPEEFAAAGFDNVEPIPEEYRNLNSEIKACFFDSEIKNYVMSLSSTNANRKIVESKRKIPARFRSQSLPPLFVYGTGLPDDSDCYAQVDTKRGGLTVSVTQPPGLGSFEESCNVAIASLESLFENAD